MHNTIICKTFCRLLFVLFYFILDQVYISSTLKAGNILGGERKCPWKLSDGEYVRIVLHSVVATIETCNQHSQSLQIWTIYYVIIHCITSTSFDSDVCRSPTPTDDVMYIAVVNVARSRELYNNNSAWRQSHRVKPRRPACVFVISHTLATITIVGH